MKKFFLVASFLVGILVSVNSVDASLLNGFFGFDIYGTMENVSIADNDYFLNTTAEVLQSRVVQLGALLIIGAIWVLLETGFLQKN